MTQHSDTDFEIDPIRPRTSALRWLLRGALTTCGAMMALVILSDPRVNAQLRAGVAHVSGLIGNQDVVTQLDTETAPSVPVFSQDDADDAPVAKAPPKVNAMPTNRVPVRRGSISFED